MPALTWMLRVHPPNPEGCVCQNYCPHPSSCTSEDRCIPRTMLPAQAVAPLKNTVAFGPLFTPRALLLGAHPHGFPLSPGPVPAASPLPAPRTPHSPEPSANPRRSRTSFNQRCPDTLPPHTANRRWRPTPGPTAPALAGDTYSAGREPRGEGATLRGRGGGIPLPAGHRFPGSRRHSRRGRDETGPPPHAGGGAGGEPIRSRGWV